MKLLLGAGPSPVPQRVLEALARPTIGHLDPEFGAVMERCTENLRLLFGTGNRATLPISATGSGGMQAIADNWGGPDRRVVCGVCGLFGARMADALARTGSDVVRVTAPWGRAVPPEQLIAAVAEAQPDALFVVHAETSTGVRQPLDGLGEACRATDALLLLDCVTSLGGMELKLDEQGVDVAFSGTQKCLNCPPGLAPFTAGERALARLPERGRSWYFDLRLLLAYWDAPEGGRVYHHTAPINMIFGLDEALRIVLEEGLQARAERHAQAHEALRSALNHLGMERIAPAPEALCSLLCMRLPDGVDEAALRSALLREHGVEVSAGVGEFAGSAWRIGVMGEGARPEPQERLVRALGALLPGDGDGALAALRAGWA